MHMYDVLRRDLYRIKSQTGIGWNIALLPGESVEGLGGVQVIPMGRRIIIIPMAQARGYHIDYDADGNVTYPITPPEIDQMIRDLTEIGCYEYTPDLLRTLKQRKEELLPFEVDHSLRL